VGREDWGLSETDWQTLLFAPLWVVTLVGGADGTISPAEFDALGQRLREARPVSGRLAHDLVETLATEYVHRWHQYERDPRPARVGLAAVAAILDRRSSDREGFLVRAALVDLGVDVAQASRSRLVGPRTSAAEERAIAEVRAALAGEAGAEPGSGA